MSTFVWSCSLEAKLTSFHLSRSGFVFFSLVYFRFVFLFFGKVQLDFIATHVFFSPASNKKRLHHHVVALTHLQQGHVPAFPKSPQTASFPPVQPNTNGISSVDISVSCTANDFLCPSLSLCSSFILIVLFILLCSLQFASNLGFKSVSYILPCLDPNLDQFKSPILFPSYS